MVVALPLLLVIGTGLAWVAVGAVQGQAMKAGADICSFTLVSVAGCALGAWALCPDWSALAAGRTERLAELVLVQGLSGLANVGGSLLMCAAMRRGGTATVWSLGQSAMVVPFLAGVLLWGDACPAITLAGLLLTIVGITLLGLHGAVSEAGGAIWVLLITVAFLLIGLDQVLAGLPSRWEGWRDAAGLRVPIQAGAMLLLLVGIACWRRRLPGRAELRLGALSAAAGLGGMVLLMAALDACGRCGLLAPVFPIAIGVCIIGVALWSVFVLGERANRRLVSGLALITAGIACLAG